MSELTPERLAEIRERSEAAPPHKILWTGVTAMSLIDRIEALEAELAAAKDFIREVAGGEHSQLCPLEHPAYRHKWCHACEANKLLAETKEKVD